MSIAAQSPDLDPNSSSSRQLRNVDNFACIARLLMSDLDKLTHLFVFGASYCQTNASYSYPAPTSDMPLGVPWPGSTYNEEDKPNWVGHLVTKKKGEPLLVYNFAKGGETVEGVLPQVHHFMEYRFPDAKKPDKITFQPEVLNNALFAIWIGINDVCADIDPPEVVGMLFEDSIESLYITGARNFLIFNVPPRIRQSGLDFKPSPGYTKHHDKIRRWNIALEEHLKQLEQKEGVSVHAIDSWSLFTDVFDNPEKYGFTAKDVNKAYGGKMWMDGLHPKSAFHGVIADTVVDRLAA